MGAWSIGQIWQIVNVLSQSQGDELVNYSSIVLTCKQETDGAMQGNVLAAPGARVMHAPLWEAFPMEPELKKVMRWA